MSVSFQALIDHLDTTGTVTIATRRADGEERTTPIWSVAVGDQPYVRSAYGPDSWWYKRAIARGAAFLVDGEWMPVRAQYVDDDATIAAVDAAYSTKYARQRASLQSVLTAEARACTLRLVPT